MTESDLWERYGGHGAVSSGTVTGIPHLSGDQGDTMLESVDFFLFPFLFSLGTQPWKGAAHTTVDSFLSYSFLLEDTPREAPLMP